MRSEPTNNLKTFKTDRQQKISSCSTDRKTIKNKRRLPVCSNESLSLLFFAPWMVANGFLWRTESTKISEVILGECALIVLNSCYKSSFFFSYPGGDIWRWYWYSSHSQRLGIGWLWPYMAKGGKLPNPTLYSWDLPPTNKESKRVSDDGVCFCSF